MFGEFDTLLADLNRLAARRRLFDNEVRRSEDASERTRRRTHRVHSRWMRRSEAWELTRRRHRVYRC
eukprot:923137-Prymnesium_polylepis.1